MDNVRLMSVAARASPSGGVTKKQAVGGGPDPVTVPGQQEAAQEEVHRSATVAATSARVCRYLAHDGAVHADELDREGIADELLLHLHRHLDDLDDALVGKLVDQLVVHQACEVAVEALVAADELVGEAEALGTKRRRATGVS